MIPTLALGTPCDVVTAIQLSALVIQGITPGVRLMAENLEVVHAIFVALILVNVVMFAVAFPLVGVFGRLLAIPQHLVTTGIVMFSILGAVTVRATRLMRERLSPSGRSGSCSGSPGFRSRHS